MADETWRVDATKEVDQWLTELSMVDPGSARQVASAIDVLKKYGPSLGRPLVDRISGSVLANLKELRPGSSGRTELRILFAFDPFRRAILLVAGNKAGRWRSWYRTAIPEAERRYRDHLERLGKDGTEKGPRR